MIPCLQVLDTFEALLGNKMSKLESQSIPIFGCRWGLGEGVSPSAFKMIPIPPHLLSRQAASPIVAETARRVRGRGRAASLTSGAHELPSPGESALNLCVTSLSIGEQISRTAVPIHQLQTDFRQYIIPSQDSDDEAPLPRAPAAVARGQRIADGLATGPPPGSRDWACVLNPGGGVVAVESALQPSNLPTAQFTGGVDAQSAIPYRIGAPTDSDDSDCYEERTSSSGASISALPLMGVRRWRPRPPPLDTLTFPPLPGQTSATRDSAEQPAANSAPEWNGPAKRHNNPEKQQTGHRARRAAPAVQASGPADRSSQRASPAARSSQQASPATRSSQPTSVTSELSKGSDDSVKWKDVRVTGVTDDNWQLIQQFVEQYGTLVRHRRDPTSNTGWVALSPPDTAEWLVSLQERNTCDIAGVSFWLSDDDDADDDDNDVN